MRVPLRARTKAEALDELVALVLGAAAATDSGEVRQRVDEREAELSTGIGDGVAIPHARTDRVSELRLAAGTAPDGIDYEALDGRPVRLLFLLVGPHSCADDHVRALSRIARVVRRDDVRQQLAAAADEDAFLEVLERAEPR